MTATGPQTLADGGDGGGSDDDVRILDDSPVSAWAYRVGMVFDLYHNGESVKFRATEIVERDGRRITYGRPV